MPLPRVELLRKVTTGRNTLALHFRKPEGFDYRAGQYAAYTLIDPPETDTEGDSREFTLASAPYEDYLACAVRLRDTAFKRVLRGLPLGAKVEIDGPIGSFVLSRRNERPAVLLTGGIGVTPARSIIAQTAHDGSTRRVTLIYSAKNPADAPYLGELTELAATHANIAVHATMTAPAAAEQGWMGRRGRIDGEWLTQCVPDLAEPVFYLCGPAEMVRAMRKLLAEAGVDDEDIRTEEFLGY